MAIPLKTSRAPEQQRISQFSVFMANKVGSLLDLVRYFDTANTHIVAMSATGFADASVVRIVFDDPESARKILHEQEIAFTECNLVVVELPDGPIGLSALLASLLQAEINVHHSYSFLTRPRGKATIAFYVDDEEDAREVLTKSGYTLLDQRDISR